MEKLFKYVVGVSTLLFVLYWVLPYIEPIWLTEDGLNLTTWANYGSYLPVHPFIYWGLFTAWLAISIGLFFFIPVARTAFLIFTVLTCIATFFWGFAIASPISAGVGVIVTLSDGVILAMAYLTSVANRFTGSAGRM